MKIRKLLTMCLLAALPTMGFAQQTFTMNLWTGKASEKSVDKSDTAKVMVFLPEKKKATGRAVVICPGGGYAGLSMQSEGTDWAEFLNNMGIAAFVL
ncbi:MAG: alpha/beta hydrolase, partial [Prevotella sp.]|nr:alpha/beta hydrolase [Prevotella sp.]